MADKKQISYQDIIREEYKKCMESPVYFMKKYVKIQHRIRGTILFDLYPFQEETLQAFHDFKFNIILKSRQMGISTLVAAFVLWMMIFNRDKGILIISLKQDDAKDVITKVRFANDNLPTWLKVKTVEDNRLSLKLANGSEVQGASTTKKSGVGKALSLLIIDEAALIDEADDLWTSAQPTLSCIDKSHLVLTDKGLVRLEQLIDNTTKVGFNDVKLSVHDGENIVPASSFYMSEKSDIYEIKFKSGGKLLVTKNHPLMTKSGWKTIEDIKEKEDCVLCKYNQNIFGNPIDFTLFNPNIRKDAVKYNLSNIDICYLAGLWTAEGHFSKGRVGITNTDEEIIKWLENIGFKHSDERHYYIYSAWIQELLKWIGCSGIAHTKRVPSKILSASFDEQTAFLQGLFDGDGCSLKEKGIKLTSVSYELLSNVRAMLLNLGIYSYIKEVVWKSTKSTVIFDKSRTFLGYELYIGGFDAHSFYSTIGFRIRRKQEGWNCLPLKSIKRIFPDKIAVKNLILESGMSIREFSKKYKCYYDRYLWYGGRGLSISSVETLLDVCNSINTSKDYKLIKQQYDKDISEFYDMVMSVRYIKNDFSYDLKIPSSEKFICEGYINHNTGGNCIILSCVTKDTMVITPDGIKEIGDFINPSKIGGYETKQYGVMGVNGIRFGNLLHNNGKQKTNIIKTKFSELECTENHKLWAYKKSEDKFGWYESSKLKVGDYISLQYGKRVWGCNDCVIGFMPSVSSKIQSPFSPKSLTPDLCYLLGLYIAEGSVYKVLNNKGILTGGSLTITCGDNISWIFDKLGLTYNCWDGIHYTVSNKNLIEFMEYLGFDLSYHANKKCIPSRLLEMPEENIKWLLRGIFDGDGSGTAKVVKLTSTSKKLIDQTRIILSNFGILGGVYTETLETVNSRSNKIKFNYQPYNLEIYGKYALKFYNLIGFGLYRKQKNINEFEAKNMSRSCSHDIIPNSLNLVKSLVASSGMTYYEINKKYGIAVNGYCNSKTIYKTSNISRDNLLLLYSLFSNNLLDDQKNYWDRILHENIVWCEITSIIGSENETFDFSLPEVSTDFWCHSVIYNGVIGHQTPRGVGNWFHKMWQGAQESNDGKIGKNGFHPITLPWNLHPDRDETWRKVEGEKQGSPKKAAQEYDCNFLSSGDNVVDLNIIEFYKKNKMCDPIEVTGIDHGLWIWEYPNYEHSYIVSADVARGDGADFSAAHVIDIAPTQPNQVAEYKGTLGTKDFGNFLVELSTKYRDALLIVERESIGWAVLQAIIDREYKNTFYSSSDIKYVDVQRQLSYKYDAEDRKLVPGFSTNLKTRPMVISNLVQYFSQLSIDIHSRRTLSELETFIWKNAKAQAMDGYNDDLVMALGIGLWVRDTAIRLRQEGIELTKMGLGNISVNKLKEIPIYKQKQREIGEKAWRMNTGRQGFGNQNTEDLRWLLS